MLWAGIGQLSKQSAIRRLGGLKKYYPQDLRAPTSFLIDGEVNYDRAMWLSAALDFGKRRFSDPSNTLERQYQRLRELHVIAQNERRDGKPEAQLAFWDVLQARAQLCPGSAAGSDGNNYDVYKMLPFSTIIQVFDMLGLYASHTFCQGVPAVVLRPLTR